MKCDNPVFVDHDVGKIPVQCGKCPPCRKRRVDSWVFRLQQEAKVSSHAHFVTLTYDTVSVPITDNGFMTLRKSDLQNFFKRLRQIISRNLTDFCKIKYYAVGEYGERRHRPHYHAIIFNCPSIRFYSEAWSLLDNQGVRKSFGGIDVGTVTGGSIAYCAKYLDKPRRRRKHSREDFSREFSVMSKGLGKNYIDNYQVFSYHRENPLQLYVTKPGGFRIAMPRYYREKIFDVEERRSQLPLIKVACEKSLSEAISDYDRAGEDAYKNFAEQRAFRKKIFELMCKKRNKL